jgi:hypothetical protein
VSVKPLKNVIEVDFGVETAVRLACEQSRGRE